MFLSGKLLNRRIRKRCKKQRIEKWHEEISITNFLKMTRSTEDNMASVAAEVNQMDTDYGKNFKILMPNDQIKGKFTAHISLRHHQNLIFLSILFRTSDNFERQKHKPKWLQILRGSADSARDWGELEPIAILWMFGCNSNRFVSMRKLETSQFLTNFVFLFRWNLWRT